MQVLMSYHPESELLSKDFSSWISENESREQWNLPVKDRPGCLYCSKTFHGRSDKKFCTDYCRNAYHNERNSLRESNSVNVINRILENNRSILQDLKIPEYQVIEIPKEQLLQKGFEFRFLTHHIHVSNKEAYYFCYEFAYAFVGKMCLIGKGRTTF